MELTTGTMDHKECTVRKTGTCMAKTSICGQHYSYQKGETETKKKKKP